MPKPITIEPEFNVTPSNAASEEHASRAHALASGSPAQAAIDLAADPRLDGAAPGEVFARHCPKCGKLKMTADQSGKTPCRACRVAAGEPYERVALPPPPKGQPVPESPSEGNVAPGTTVERADRIPLDDEELHNPE